MESSRFLITDSIAKVAEYVSNGDKESAFNFASLVVWRVGQYESWMTDNESAFIDKCLKFKPRRRPNV
jgi:hypothetical protein